MLNDPSKVFYTVKFYTFLKVAVVKHCLQIMLILIVVIHAFVLNVITKDKR